MNIYINTEYVIYKQSEAAMRKFWEKKICGIYKITHRESGMCYIGLSTHIFHRWKSHVSTKKKYKIHEAFDQFGIDAFFFEVVEKCDKKELRKRERHWIKHYDCVWPKGYNMNKGGGGTVKHSKETLRKMSDNEV
jgi:group I intron endonuclease